MNRFPRFAARGLLAALVCLTAGCNPDISDAAGFERRYQAQLDAMQALCADSIRYLAISSAWDSWQVDHYWLFSARKIVAATVRGTVPPASAQTGPPVFEVKSLFPAKVSFPASAFPTEGKSVVETGMASFREELMPVFRYRHTVRGWNGGLYMIELTAER